MRRGDLYAGFLYIGRRVLGRVRMDPGFSQTPRPREARADRLANISYHEIEVPTSGRIDARWNGDRQMGAAIKRGAVITPLTCMD
jgi:hypothetical protein